MQGWTADDYEVGGKGKAEHFDERHSAELADKKAGESQNRAPEGAGNKEWSADSDTHRASSNSSPSKTQSTSQPATVATAATTTAAVT